ncbi:MAG: pilus assembly protein TadG-related protein [Hyphomicrobiaceae bacterium]
MQHREGACTASFSALAKCFKRLAMEQRGSVAIMTGLLIIPLFLVAGLAIDYSRAISVKHQLQFAADAAALAARGSTEDATEAARAAAAAFVQSNTEKLGGVTLDSVTLTPTTGGYLVSLKATMPTSLSAAVGVETWDVDAEAESVRASSNIEVALVLDNTGSMSGSMDDLKTGAKDLVEALFGSQSVSNRVKMAVVPYVGTVNIGSGATQMSWMDVNAISSHAGRGLSWHWAGFEPGCVYTPGAPQPEPGTGLQGSLVDPLRKLARLFGEAFAISKAHAATAGDVPPGYNFEPDCWFSNPAVNFFTLFNQINVPWKGCVMSRDEGDDRDVSDEAPDSSDGNTLFVPWFWPDTVDQAAISAEGYAWDTPNDYLPDRMDLRDAAAPKFNDPWIGRNHLNLFKYSAGATPSVDETGPSTHGPNKSCPDALLPLTNAKLAVTDKIDSLTYWFDSGTNVAEGVAWGMRVLTPGAPFTEGSSDPKVKKVMVLMTDGVNNLDPSTDTSTNSQWSSYSYLRDGRIEPRTYDGFRAKVNDRLAKACDYAKQANIEIYTVAFGIGDAETNALLETCASKPPYAYSASTAQEMVEAFQAIGRSLSELRLSR